VTHVAAVIGNFQGGPLLRDCLESLRGQTLVPAEVIVVDAGSSDGSDGLARGLGATLLRAPNHGIGSLYNRGAEAARTELVLLANNDVAFDPRCLELLAGAFTDDPTLFAADPTQTDWDGRRTIHARVAMRRGPLLRQPLPGFRIDQTVQAERPIETVMAGGGAMLVRRALLLELGGFDETFFMEFEELDLCWRAWLRGWRSIYVPEAVCRHAVGMATTAAIKPRRVSSAHHNLVRFALKCLPPRAAARVLAGELLRLPAHPRLIAPALAQVVRELPAILGLRARLSPSTALCDWILDGQRGPVPVRGAREVLR